MDSAELSALEAIGFDADFPSWSTTAGHELRSGGLETNSTDPTPPAHNWSSDIRSGEVRIKGPATKEEKAQYKEWREQKKQIAAGLEEMQQPLIDDPDYQYRE